VVLAAITAVVAVVTAFLRWGTVERPVAEVDGVKQVSAVAGSGLAVYDGTNWDSRFWHGINLGATLPGHSPGELAPTKQDYLRWFPQMKEMNVDVIRVYTILNPEFYEALREFNSRQEEPLWLIQGVWSPEEELIGDDEEGRDAYAPEVTETFEREISDAVAVVHGDADLPRRTGHASGRYRAGVSEYLLGWMVGTEWYPLAVQTTDQANHGMEPYSGEYFRATEEATPFESWMARLLDRLAKEEMEYGWQHPVSFTNWATTDPLSHPNEANEQEDLVSVDPMHVEPTSSWNAGYFAQYHVYPYYPDFLRYETEYRNYRAADGEVDPYAGYLNELRGHHEGIPLLVGEFGLPTSRGMAHRGPLGRDQGYHTEEEQGRLLVGMLEAIRNEGFDGALLFAWQDEWFKFTWNTLDLELPPERRDRWRNRLTNEEHFGVLATEPGDEEHQILLDGDTDDWENRERGLVGRFAGLFADRPAGVSRAEYEDFSLAVTHDAAYVYLLLRKRDGVWKFPEDDLDVGFGTLPDGASRAGPAPGLIFPKDGIQFLLRMNGEGASRMLVNSAYDQHTWNYGKNLGIIPEPDASEAPSAGDFLPWKLMLSRELFLPQTKERIPPQEIEVGVMRRGITDPSSPEFNNLSDWYAEDDVLEVRIPWMLLGFTDPSSHQVWNYPYETGDISPAETLELRIYPATEAGNEGEPRQVQPLRYTWDSWEDPAFHERKKKSFDMLKEAYSRDSQPTQPESATGDGRDGT
jgi:hypothetical protein